jgi:hypothetical protein
MQQERGTVMHSLTSLMRSPSKAVRFSVFVLGVVILLGTWVVAYGWELLFTESHLVGYHCCVSEQDLPAPGTLERTLSDYFQLPPGKHLPSLVFVAASVSIFAVTARSTRGEHWWLPLMFVSFNIVYFGASLALVNLSWSLSNSLVGPRTSAYAGYQRTWYGIVSHLMLWGLFFSILSRVSRKIAAQGHASSATANS